jgi:putative polyhydroxyalkanoate system protein
MSTIKVEKSHQLPIEDAKKAIDRFGEDLKSKYGMNLAWSGNVATLKGTGASGDIEVEPERVVVTVKLGMLAKAAGIKADKVEASIDKRLDAALRG